MCCFFLPLFLFLLLTAHPPHLIEHLWFAGNSGHCVGVLKDGGDFFERQSSVFKGFPLSLEIQKFDSMQ